MEPSIDTNDLETIHDVASDNVEMILKRVHEVDEATATVHRRMSDDEMMLHATYEGELDRMDTQTVFRDAVGFQAMRPMDKIDQNKVEFIYLFLTEESTPNRLFNFLTEHIEERQFAVMEAPL